MFTLAIVGRPNVGKSTLFNRLAGKKLAIINDTPGVTRDWREAEGHIGEQVIRIIDTAGLEEEFDESIRGRMRAQTEAALKQANAVLFMIDGRSGITPLDEHFAGWLRRQNIPVILGVNKCENERETQTACAEAYGLGLGDPLPLSAAHGIGMADLHEFLKPLMLDFAEEEEEDENEEDESFLVDSVIDSLEGQEEDFLSMEETIDPEKPIKLAIVGRPNVGKSTLMNALLGEHRVMTGPEAGITRDAIAADWEYEGRAFRLVDTAGMRRKSKVQDAIEKMSVEDARRAIRLAQVVVLVLDANAALEKQDQQIAEHIINEGRALIIALNKWDTIEEKREMLEEIKHMLGHSLAQVRDIPFVAISALNGRNLNRLMDEVLKIYEVWNRRVSTGKLNRWLAAMESQHPAPLVQNAPNRLKYIAQIKARPPTFALWVSRPKELPDAYRRYIINGLREDFDIPGVPIRILVRSSKNPYT